MVSHEPPQTARLPSGAPLERWLGVIMLTNALLLQLCKLPPQLANLALHP